MKKVYILFFMFLVSANFYAQTLAGAKICIDPGHGGHDPADDRYIAATGFWESDANWAKANFLKPMLQNLGANVKLTRTGNNDSDDLPLSTRCQIANEFGADYFHSIHSNGYNGQSNYTLMLFRGYDNNPVFPLAKTMGEYLATNIQATNRTTAKYNRGDWSFYPDWGTSGLGVLRTLTMPGTLSEGSFHDYIPESWRLMNDAYRYHEMVAIARSFIQLFNDFPYQHGAIAGIVRDPLQTVSYYYIASLGDAKKPINNIKVTLQPGNRVYQGDSKNNGFFMFDSVAPGTYKLYYEAENYALDSATVTVTSNKTSFADKNMTQAANYNPPTILSVSPANNSNNVRLKASITFTFDISMDKASTLAAFEITPNISGLFTWSDNDKTMIFTPSTFYPANTLITAKVKNTAKSIFNVNMANDYVISFTTRSKLNILTAYPKNNDEKISPTVNVRVIFDAPLKQSTLSGGNVSFVNSAGASVPIYVDVAGYALGKITFDPQNPLTPGETYKLTIKSGVGDMEGLFLGQDYEFSFKVDDEIYQSGQVLDQFEAVGGWWDPNNSGSTTGTNPDATTFTIVSDKKVNGSKSGKISYTFTGANGVVRTFNSSKPSIGSSTNSKVGVWVYGDLSYNTLEYWFYYNSSTNAIVFVDTINWTGWKIKYINSGSIAGSGDKLFHSIVIKQTANGATTGAIYVDDLQKDIVTDVEEDYEINVSPTEFVLNQNYPNPFNPSTVISFSIPKAENVKLSIYNILGEKIVTLLNSDLNVGNYKVTWNGKNALGVTVPSGVYFYKLETPTFSQSRKMMLVK